MTTKALSATLAALFCLGTASHATAQAPAATTVQPPQPRGISITPSLDIPFSTDAAADEGSSGQGVQLPRSARLGVTARYSPHQTWFARFTAYGYLDSSQKMPWHPDFTYSVGYDDWHPGTFGLTYDNYNGNRFNPDGPDGYVTRVEEGSVTASYKVPMPTRLQEVFGPAPNDHLTASVAFHLTPRYWAAGVAERQNWKRAVSGGARYRFYRWFFVESRLFYYPSSDQQQPWDPDFTYAFGYFDWHPGTLSVQYANYSGNRFAGHDRPGTGAFRSGALSVSYTRAW